MKLIVGLGNVGKEYDNTRHNVGFFLLDEYLKDIKWLKNNYGFYYKDKNIVYLKPTTYMNLSGNAISYFMNYFKISIENILIIQDDLDMKIGTVKIKLNSSSGGHNGIKSIIQQLRTNEFLRLKIGISKSESITTSDYVLGKFTREEMNTISLISKDVNNILNDFISGESSNSLMNKYNG